jgi:N6-L-threonylcarbamoyladenine synthase
MLLQKLKKASKNTGISNIAIAGGVSANSELRKRLAIDAEKYGWKIFVPEFQYCTDNAAMIAMTAYFKYLKKDFEDLSVMPQPRMKFH